jgi:hypothetical protein
LLRKAQQVAKQNKNNIQQFELMKITTIAKAIIAAMLLSGSAMVSMAQGAAAAVCPFGHEPGYGRSLTPEQKAAYREVVQVLLAQLQAKRDAGTITAEEAAWLAQVEKRGGMCINGVPRGPRDGKGLRGGGNGQRRGLRDGTGPRNVDGVRPPVNNTPRAGRR